jgi:hypothetical protein
MARGSGKSAAEFSIEDVSRHGFFEMPDSEAIYEKRRVRILSEAAQRLRSPVGSLGLFFDQMDDELLRAFNESSRHEVEDLLLAMADEAIVVGKPLSDYSILMFNCLGIPGATSLTDNHLSELYKAATPVIYDYMKAASRGDITSPTFELISDPVRRAVEKRVISIAADAFSSLDPLEKLESIARPYPGSEVKFARSVAYLRDAIVSAYGPDVDSWGWAPPKKKVGDIFMEEWDNQVSPVSNRKNVIARMVGTFLPDAIPHFIDEVPEDRWFKEFVREFERDFPEASAKKLPSTFKRLLKRKR